VSLVALRSPFLRGTRPDNPAAATFHNSREQLLYRNSRNWRLAFFLVLCAALFLTGAVWNLTNKQQEFHYAVKVYEDGSRGMRVLMKEPTALDDQEVLFWILKRWIRDIRMLTADMDANYALTAESAKMALTPAQQVIRAYYTETKPEEILKGGRIFPVHIRVFPQAGRTYRLTWVEELRNAEGGLVSKTPWEATVEVVFVPSETRQQKQQNPLGIWVASLHWSPVY
jgi:type IV secretory pathway TrbF-like protein